MDLSNAAQQLLSTNSCYSMVVWALGKGRPQSSSNCLTCETHGDTYTTELCRLNKQLYIILLSLVSLPSSQLSQKLLILVFLLPHEVGIFPALRKPLLHVVILTFKAYSRYFMYLCNFSSRSVFRYIQHKWCN